MEIKKYSTGYLFLLKAEKHSAFWVETAPEKQRRSGFLWMYSGQIPGTITVDGKPFHPRNFRIGYLPEERGLYPKKGVLEQLMYLAQLRGSSRTDARKQAMRWLKRLGVEEYAQRKLETLSKGNQQKVQLAQTLVCDPGPGDSG